MSQVQVQVQVLAVITAKPGMRDQILAAYRDNLAAVHAEDGCIAYEAVVDVEGDTPFAKFGLDTFVVVEKWASMAALQAHSVAPHMKSYAAKTKEWTAKRAIHVLKSA